MPEPRLPNADQFPAEPVRRRRTPAGMAILVVFATLLVTLFLDADGLMRTAERQHQGFQRTVTVGFMRPVRAIADTLGLTAPRRFLARATGHDQSTDFSSTEGVKLAAGTEPRGAAATTTTTTLPSYRVPTSADPLRVLVAGDSLSGYLGPSLGRALSAVPANVIQDQQVGTGLARPDVVDWPRELQYDMDTHRPDTVVLFIGGNDDQDLRTPDGWIPIADSAEWEAEYERRIAQIMDIVAQPGVSVYWIGLPAMGKAHLNRYVPTINRLIEREAAARPGSVTFVDSGRALDGPDGGFTTYLTDSSGKQITARAPDGVHPTPSGMDRIVALFAPELIRSRHLDTPPPTTVPSHPAGTATGSPSSRSD